MAKIDAAGDMQWNRTYSGPGYAEAMVQTDDGGYALAGGTGSHVVDSDFWLVKVGSSGNMQWNTTHGGANDDTASSLVQTSDGGYALAGSTESFGAGSSDFWLVKTDSYGNHQWNRTYGGADWDVASSVVETSDGGFAVTGTTESFGAGIEALLVKVDSSGNMEWSKTYGGDSGGEASCIIESSDGGYVFAGSTRSFGADDDDFWLVKTDSSGNIQWNKIYAPAPPESGRLILYIGLASAILIAAVAITVVYIKRKKHTHAHLAAIVVATAVVTSILLVFLHLSYPVAPPLKQNVYTKTFTDSKGLVSLDVITYYETELDGSWRVWYRGGKEYNVTVLVKPTFIDTSALSMLRILQCHVGIPYRWDAVVHYLGEYHPVWFTPLDHGIDLNPYWTSKTAWTAGRGMATYAKGDPSQFSFDYVPLWYHFVFRLIETDGTREIFTAEDEIIRIPFTSTDT